MALTGKNRRLGRKTCLSATLYHMLLERIPCQFMENVVSLTIIIK